jgi:hypothetical protein
MFLCIEVFNSLEVEEGVGGYLVVLGVFSGHGLEVLGTPFGQKEGGTYVNNDTGGCDTEENDWVEGKNDGEDEDKLHDKGEDLEKGHSKNHTERLRAAGDGSNDFTCLARQMEGQRLVLYLSVNHMCDVDFS